MVNIARKGDRWDVDVDPDQAGCKYNYKTTQISLCYML